MKQLQQLLLHCPKFVTLSGRVAGQGYSAWERVGGVVRYQSQQCECGFELVNEKQYVAICASAHMHSVCCHHLAAVHGDTWYVSSFTGSDDNWKQALSFPRLCI
jgi:hypothetical protein